MDVTILFKACVKTVRTTNRNLGIKEDKTNILKISKDHNLIKAREIIKHISKLHNYLLENKKAYLNVLNYLSTNKTMTEINRQEIDVMAQKIINTCSLELNAYRQGINKQSNNSKQRMEHYYNVGDSMEKYLKQISKIYTEIKAIRVKRVLETHNLSKLESKVSINVLKKTIKKEEKSEALEELTPIPIVPLPTPAIENIEEQLSPEELQMFESENELLYDELSSISEEVQQIESKVVHISELQELFTENVLQQEQDIERIANNVTTSTDNMKDANEQIRQAIQRNAGLRVWVLFFLLVMSFSLLFLDWYND